MTNARRLATMVHRTSDKTCKVLEFREKIADRWGKPCRHCEQVIATIQLRVCHVKPIQVRHVRIQAFLHVCCLLQVM